ncbi:hypothetical protein BG844_28685 [Couchioplanes caeruleus subsp. caeruleus]|uniref:Histidine kinase/HSP90-like ATPase domain-containing protein n=1 Tax=Couchioplanes caeruleus subsp. caeruleus TaxID=56427 RepID=A0A1K0FE45_9ACTN|nr:hypothetical protein BG844_28685 [Couchioplanes caeruleus subsp. caeruleus]
MYVTGGARPVEGELVSPQPAAVEPIVLLSQHFTEMQVSSLRSRVSTAVAESGLFGELAEGFVLAAHELVTNAVRHGGGVGHLELRLRADELTCEIVDNGGQADGLPVRLAAPEQTGGRGLWLAHQLTGTLLLTQRPDGVTASVTACLTPAPVIRSAGTLRAKDTMQRNEDR